MDSIIEMSVCKKQKPSDEEKKLKKQSDQKKYYADNKDEILRKLCTRKTCDKCGSLVIHQYMNRHQLKNICSKRSVDYNKPEIEA